ncbi:uncharacterized protein LOC124682796 [Lolium rigidum]|uniref:uncharacterized protein LOC124682796 n=1 Tax=Lolium rigidum TaxID=89674 RepID=UPI001F5CE35D|nr:uncharacterized protein LOC124682796 [Lolium rigidum]
MSFVPAFSILASRSSSASAPVLAKSKACPFLVKSWRIIYSFDKIACTASGSASSDRRCRPATWYRSSSWSISRSVAAALDQIHAVAVQFSSCLGPKRRCPVLSSIR